MGIVELAPFSVAELGIDFETLPKYLLRGGFPQSWLAPGDDASFEGRDAFVRSFSTLLPVEVELSLGSRAIPQVEIDQTLVRNANVFRD